MIRDSHFFQVRRLSTRQVMINDYFFGYFPFLINSVFVQETDQKDCVAHIRVSEKLIRDCVTLSLCHFVIMSLCHCLD